MAKAQPEGGKSDADTVDRSVDRAEFPGDKQHTFVGWDQYSVALGRERVREALPVVGD